VTISESCHKVFILKKSLLTLMVPWRNFNIHGNFYWKFFIVENGSWDFYNFLHTKGGGVEWLF